MNRLTHEKHGAAGYGSAAKRGELVQRLGAIEHRAPRLIEQACELCHLPYVTENQDELEEKCEICPLIFLEKLIAGEYPAEM